MCVYIYMYIYIAHGQCSLQFTITRSRFHILHSIISKSISNFLFLFFLFFFFFLFLDFSIHTWSLFTLFHIIDINLLNFNRFLYPPLFFSFFFFFLFSFLSPRVDYLTLLPLAYNVMVHVARLELIREITREGHGN